MERVIRRPQPRPFAAFVRRHRLASYFALAYALSWLVWIPMALAREKVTIGGSATHLPGLFGPLFAALVVTRIADGATGLELLRERMMRWRVKPQWALVAVASPLVAFVVAAAAVGWPRWHDLGLFNGAPAIGVVGLWLLLVGAGFGEETGWRGFALPRLERTHSPLAATSIVALAWAGWHLPAFFVVETYRGFSPVALLGFLVGLFCGAVVLTWLYHRTGDSILMVALWHGSFNLASGTLAARGPIAAIVSTMVMIGALVLVGLELRARRRGQTVLGARAAAASRSPR